MCFFVLFLVVVGFFFEVVSVYIPMIHIQKEVELADSVIMSCFRRLLTEVVIYAEEDHCNIAR